MLTPNFAQLALKNGIASSDPLEEQVATLLDLTTAYSRLTGELHEGSPLADDSPDSPWVGVAYFPSQGGWRPVVVAAVRPTAEYNNARVQVAAVPFDREPVPTLEQLVAQGYWPPAA